jgi:enoyl-[acyl-carrier protein] reductase I
MLMQGKRGLIMGVANDKSIAWGIAKVLAEHGAEIALTYQSEQLKKRVAPLAERINCSEMIECDVCDDASIESVFQQLSQGGKKLDFVVHAIAFSDKAELKGKYYDTSRENFRNSLDISCYSFTAVAKYAAPHLNDGSSLLTLSYYGAEKYIPHYNVMGVAKAALEASIRYMAVDFGDRAIRVNAISAGPVRTLAASGIGDFRKMLKYSEDNSPLRRNILIEEAGDGALYLLSDLSRAVSGEVLHVDSGYHAVGMSTNEEYI